MPIIRDYTPQQKEAILRRAKSNVCYDTRCSEVQSCLQVLPPETRKKIQRKFYTRNSDPRLS